MDCELRATRRRVWPLKPTTRRLRHRPGCVSHASPACTSPLRCLRRHCKRFEGECGRSSTTAVPWSESQRACARGVLRSWHGLGVPVRRRPCGRATCFAFHHSPRIERHRALISILLLCLRILALAHCPTMALRDALNRLAARLAAASATMVPLYASPGPSSARLGHTDASTDCLLAVYTPAPAVAVDVPPPRGAAPTSASIERVKRVERVSLPKRVSCALLVDVSSG